MGKRIQQQREELLDVCHYEKQLYEMPIPGMEAYTIDAEMMLRSYKSPGSPRVLCCKQNKHGGYEYNLWCVDENGLKQKMSFSPLRLYLCACSGLDPRKTTLDSFELDAEGFPVAVNMRVKGKIRRSPGTLVTSQAYRKEMSDKEKQIVQAARTEYEAKILRKCVESEDYTELLDLMWSYKRLVMSILYVKYGIRAKAAEELFSIALEHTVRRIKRDHIVVRNILWTLIHWAQMAKLRKA